MTTLEQFSEAALARAEARQAAKGRDDIGNQIAGFNWNKATRRFDVEVGGYIVATYPDIHGVLDFCKMHHSGFDEART